MLWVIFPECSTFSVNSPFILLASSNSGFLFAGLALISSTRQLTMKLSVNPASSHICLKPLLSVSFFGVLAVSCEYPTSLIALLTFPPFSTIFSSAFFCFSVAIFLLFFEYLVVVFSIVLVYHVPIYLVFVSDCAHFDTASSIITVTANRGKTAISFDNSISCNKGIVFMKRKAPIAVTNRGRKIYLEKIQNKPICLAS